MRLKRIHPTKYELTLSTFELAALISTARWALNGAEGDLPDDAKDHLKQILDSYDAESNRINATDEA
jgi:hypothetical protein